MARSMLHNKGVARNLWGEAVNAACHMVNRVYFRPDTKKTPYELWKGRKSNVKYFRIFGSTCFILKDRENMGKFDSRSDEGIFLGYSSTSKAYRVYNKRTKKVEPTKVEEALQDESWDEAIHDKLLQFQRNDVWTLVPRLEGEHIGTKWIFHNKTNEEGNVIHNKARLVVQGYSQMEGVEYDETFAPVAHMESIRTLLALACHLKFKLSQMDLKTDFLNGLLKEDVYVAQPK
ncbi:putative mitochondrial protein AtMg00820 [Castanea sativa]|uniref:putative mitochondrial protein AtMg00820 n=1 Tax=Castanea sativa TaxID=21020 RepID=UPI003F64F799